MGSPGGLCGHTDASPTANSMTIVALRPTSK
jgi:hypothetical protein